MTTNEGHWIDTSPRGENMPIAIAYPYSLGRPTWLLKDLPPDYTVAFASPGDPEVDHFPTCQGPRGIVTFAFLVNPDGEYVATWDEGRWWTPDESNAWLLMLAAPATYAMAEGMRQQQMPRWWRRAQRRRKT